MLPPSTNSKLPTLTTTTAWRAVLLLCVLHVRTVRAGRLDESMLDRALRHTLPFRFELGQARVAPPSLRTSHSRHCVLLQPHCVLLTAVSLASPLALDATRPPTTAHISSLTTTP